MDYKNYTGYKKRTYNVDDNFFEEPNLVNCYYAGFIAADGNLPVREKGRIQIEISEKDKKLLDNFKNVIQCESPIKERIEKGKYRMVSLNFTSYKIREDLEKHFNITPQKSLTLMPPNLKEETLKYAYICGYIDGDGTICLYKRKGFDEIRLSVLGTRQMCEWIKETFNKLTNNKGSISLKPHTKIYRLAYITKSAREIVKILYLLNVPKLKRKWSDKVYEHCFHYSPQHNHTFKEINVFNLYGVLLKKCKSHIEAAEYTNLSPQVVSKLSVKNSNHFQSNGFMFSQDEEMQKYEPTTNIKASGIWRKIRKKLIEEGKIREEDFPFNFAIKTRKIKKC